jgi:hypothetical protein
MCTTPLCAVQRRHAQAWWSRATACWSRRRLRRRLLLRVEGGASSLRADSALARRSTAEWPRREGASRRGRQARADAPADRSVDGHGNRAGRLLLAIALRRSSSFARPRPRRARERLASGTRCPQAGGATLLLGGRGRPRQLRSTPPPSEVTRGRGARPLASPYPFCQVSENGSRTTANKPPRGGGGTASEGFKRCHGSVGSTASFTQSSDLSQYRDVPRRLKMEKPPGPTRNPAMINTMPRTSGSSTSPSSDSNASAPPAWSCASGRPCR